jgi:DNA polymerase III delta subunit
VLVDALGTGNRQDAMSVLRGDESSWIQVADAARSPSLFSPRLAVVVRDADRLRGDEELIDAILENPAAGITLVLLASKPDKRKRLWRKVESAAREAKAKVLSVEPLRGRALRTRVLAELRARDLSIDEEGLASLLERVGADLRRLIGELEKLTAFAAPRRRLTLDDVAAVMGKGIAQPLYRLADAFMARHPAVAVAYLEEILDEGEPAPVVVAALFRTVRQVRGARALGNAPPSEFQARLQVPAFKAEDVRRAARTWSDRDVKEAVVALMECDRRIKTGVDARTALTAAIVACSRRSEGAMPSGPRR